MDELWQRYRTFWGPVLIGLGVFLIGVIVVHIITDDPDEHLSRLDRSQRELTALKVPEAARRGQRSAAKLLEERDRTFRTDNGSWSERLNQTGGSGKNVVAAAAEQALRASILRGAPEAEAANPAALAARFGGDEVAADLAYRSFRRKLQEQVESLRVSDPNVAFVGLLSAVWSDLRIRANRADVAIAVDQLGFGTINSVTRATLPSRILNLALVARVVDAAIRHEVTSVDAIRVPPNVQPGRAEDFLVEWPVDFALTGEMPAVKRVLDMLTDPDNPVPLGATQLTQPKRGSGAATGTVELLVRASSVIVRADADLDLEVEETE